MRIVALFLLLVIEYIFSLTAHSQKILWEKSLGGKQSEVLSDIVPCPDNGFLVAGFSASVKSGNKTANHLGNYDYFIWKMNDKGEPEWQKTFGGSENEVLNSVLLTREGGFLLAGTSNSSKSESKHSLNIGKDDFWIIKLSPNGAEEWQLALGGFGQEKNAKVLQTRDGGYVIAGTSGKGTVIDIPTEEKDKKVKYIYKTEPSYGNLDYWVIKVNSEGKMEWQKTFGGSYADELKSMVLHGEDIILAGISNSNDDGTKTIGARGMDDIWLISLDKDGVEKWQKAIGSEGSDVIQTLIVTSKNELFIGAHSNSNTGHDKIKSNKEGTDLWLLKLSFEGEIIWQETYNYAENETLTSIVENQDGTFLIGAYVIGTSHFASKSKQATRKNKKPPLEDDFLAFKINVEGDVIWSKIVHGDGKDILKKVIETRDGGYLMAGNSNSSISGDKSTGIGQDDFWIVKLKDNKKPDNPTLEIEAYPNPTKQFTTIIVGYEFERGTATVADLTGRQLQQFEIQSRTVPIDLSGLPEGIYVVNIKTNVQSNGVKIIKAN
ncbi:Por secretion system C-terminal sorting domain-containing protein [Flavobacterium fontis]|uniref:Por secretion system C-terminal sorting domain-containing protein n=1 Tax=Flavobacterium fontis TaxID=1124188 RepID=A0A1M4WCB1_9FLAO|nr:T9SS type A sorting domain-containing protein [Flavobacterium fontis]SHE78790.1 Por secretion system C-terminal sorting domain-containing protein [Flavobacterium fontis]